MRPHYRLALIRRSLVCSIPGQARPERGSRSYRNPPTGSRRRLECSTTLHATPIAPDLAGHFRMSQHVVTAANALDVPAVLLKCLEQPLAGNLRQADRSLANRDTRALHRGDRQALLLHRLDIQLSWGLVAPRRAAFQLVKSRISRDLSLEKRSGSRLQPVGGASMRLVARSSCEANPRPWPVAARCF